MAKEITQNVHSFYLEVNETLPEVCESGQECRNEAWLAAKQQAQLDWQATLTQIAHEFDNAWFLSKQTMQVAYGSAYECEPGCYCEQIMTEYGEVFALEQEIKIEIATLEQQLEGLYT